HIGALGGSMGLGAGIFGKSRAGFFRLGQAQFASGHQLKPKRLEQLAKLLELSRIMGGDDQPVAAAQAGESAHLALPFFSAPHPRSSARTMSFQMAQSGAISCVVSPWAPARAGLPARRVSAVRLDRAAIRSRGVFMR